MTTGQFTDTRAPIAPPAPPTFYPTGPDAARRGRWSRLSRGKKALFIAAVVIAVSAVASLLGVGEEEDQAAPPQSAPPTSVVAPQLPAGYRLVERVSPAFSIGVPEQWTELDAGAQDVDQAMNDFVQQNPGLSDTIEAARQSFSQGGVLFAVDLSSPASFKPTITIARAPGSPGDLGAAASMFEAQLESIGAQDVVAELVELPAGPALRIQSTLTFAGAGGTPASMQTLQFVVVADGATWVLNLSSGDLAADRDRFTEIAETFRIGS
jgi:hypothetical protein